MATLQDVADRAGVSLNTASRILSGQIKGLRRDAVARSELVQRIAQELNYRPNSFAKAMRRGHFGGIALLLSTQQSRSYLPPHLLEGIEKALLGRDLHLTLTSLPDEVLTHDEVVPKILRQSMADGLLINYTHHIPQPMIDLIERNGIPCVWLNTDRREDCVRPDDETAAWTATRAFLDRGHRRIAFVHAYQADPSNVAHYSVAARLAGYSRAMTEAGLKPLALWEQHQTESATRTAVIAQWLAEPDRPTAALTYSPNSAVGLIVGAWKLGLRVPEDFSIVTFAEASNSDLGFAVATMVLPELEMGRRAVEMLERKIDAPTQRFPTELVPFTFIQGQSIAHPKT